MQFIRERQQFRPVFISRLNISAGLTLWRNQGSGIAGASIFLQPALSVAAMGLRGAL